MKWFDSIIWFDSVNTWNERGMVVVGRVEFTSSPSPEGRAQSFLNKKKKKKKKKKPFWNKSLHCTAFNLIILLFVCGQWESRGNDEKKKLRNCQNRTWHRLVGHPPLGRVVSLDVVARIIKRWQHCSDDDEQRKKEKEKKEILYFPFLVILFRRLKD